MRSSAFLMVMLAAGCASSRPDKVRFEELYPQAPEASAPGPELSVTKRQQQERRLGVGGIQSKRLRSELKAFIVRSRALRKSNAGETLPSQAMKNWLAALDAVDQFAARTPHPTTQGDAKRAQVILELVLELDVQTYKSFPEGIAQAVNERVGELALLARGGFDEGEGAFSSGSGAFLWPVRPVAVTSVFGRRLHPITRSYRLHFGVDLRAARGQRVEAAADGRVMRAGWNGGHGNQVEILHSGGVVTRYSHLSEIWVRAGSQVMRGDALGTAGNTGSSTGTHLHFEFWRRGRPCDPVEEVEGPSPLKGKSDKFAKR